MNKLVAWLPTLVLVAVALLAWQRKADTLWHVEPVEAEVLDLVQLTHRADGGDGSWMIYRFTTADGEVVSARSTYGNSAGLPEIGERVTIFYDPRLSYAGASAAGADGAEVHASRYDLVLIPAVATVLALLAMGLSYVWVTGEPKRRKKKGRKKE